jgi:Bacterial protein of unknown function (DUF899)
MISVRPLRWSSWRSSAAHTQHGSSQTIIERAGPVAHRSFPNQHLSFPNQHLSFPNESAEYRAALNVLLEAEIALRRQLEAVAALRRSLPPGGAVPEDYMFERTAPGSVPSRSICPSFSAIISSCSTASWTRTRPCLGPARHEPGRARRLLSEAGLLGEPDSIATG